MVTNALLGLLEQGLPRWTNTKTSTITPTSWMDGLRGICAIVVINFHYLFTFHPLTTLGFRTPTKYDASDHFAALPPFCLLWDGASCVNVFFALSGYVCSIKALSLMHEQPTSHAALLQTLSSSAFRRGLRLYLPVLAITLITTLLAHLHGFALTDDLFATRRVSLPGVSSEVNPPRLSTLSAQLSVWWGEMAHLMNPFESKPVYPEHDPHLWTVAYEYRMSMHLYCAHLVMALFRPRVRLLGLISLTFIYSAWSRWEGLLFFAGATAAQVEVILRKSSSIDSTKDSASPIANDSSLLEKAAEHQGHQHISRRLPISPLALARLFASALAVYLIAYPVSGYKHPAPGYEWMNRFIPAAYAHRENKFPKSIGVLILLSLLHTAGFGIVRSVLESRPALYLGKIMFSLYLVHNTVLHAVGYAVPHWVWHWTGNDTTWTWGAGLIVGWIASLWLCISAAGIFHRVVEARCVEFIRWLESAVFDKIQ